MGGRVGRPAHSRALVLVLRLMLVFVLILFFVLVFVRFVVFVVLLLRVLVDFPFELPSLLPELSFQPVSELSKRSFLFPLFFKKAPFVLVDGFFSFPLRRPHLAFDSLELFRFPALGFLALLSFRVVFSLFPLFFDSALEFPELLLSLSLLFFDSVPQLPELLFSLPLLFFRLPLERLDPLVRPALELFELVCSSLRKLVSPPVSALMPLS